MGRNLQQLQKMVEVAAEQVGAELGDRRIGRMARHAKGAEGWILRVDDTGAGGKTHPGIQGRPSFMVLTTAGQRIWWLQSRCTLL